MRDRNVIRIVTEHGNPDYFRPYRLVRAYPRLPRLARHFVQSVALWATAFRIRGTVVFVTYGSLTGFFLAWLQALLKPVRRPRTHVMFDLLLERHRSGMLGLFDRWKALGFKLAGVRAVVWGTTDGEVFSREYKIPASRFQFHPYHHTLGGFDVTVGDNGYIFAGGNNGRDYHTLIAAVRNIDFPVMIATTDPTIPPLAADLPHVQVRGVSPHEFRELLARCTFLVEAHPVDFIRTAGHQTMLNAMLLGKPIVLADTRSAVGYLESGKEGVVVEAGDARALAAAISDLLADPARRAAMGAAGRARMRDPLYGTAQHMQSIYNYALRLEYEQQGRQEDLALVECYGAADVGVVPRELQE